MCMQVGYQLQNWELTVLILWKSANLTKYATVYCIQFARIAALYALSVVTSIYYKYK